MCFSAEASFSAGIVLTTVGIIALKKTTAKSQILFAAIPFVFGIQQIIEGFLWLALKERIDPSWQISLTYLFISIAQVIWPLWVPISIAMLEKKPERKKIFYVITGIGIGISVTIIIRLLFFPVYAAVEENHIAYHLKFPVLVKYLGAASYFIATVIPCFVSSVKRMHFLGLLILLSYAAALIFYTHYAISVWCFFAAVISMIVLKISKENSLFQIQNLK